MSLATIDTETRALLEYAIPRGTDMDKMAMLQLMRSMDLNPLRREVYAIPYQGKLQIVIGVDGWRKAAHATGRYLSGEAVYGEDECGVFCTYTVLTTGGGRFSATCWLSEFKGGSPLWNRMPRHMLAVKAEVHALKRAFGLAGPTEWDHDEGRETIVGEPVRAAQDDRLAAMNRLLTSSADLPTEVSAVAPQAAPAVEQPPAPAVEPLEVLAEQVAELARASGQKRTAMQALAAAKKKGKDEAGTRAVLEEWHEALSNTNNKENMK
jgi:hypothetical protein